MHSGNRWASTLGQGKQLVLRSWEQKQEGQSGPFGVSSLLQWLSFPWHRSLSHLFSLGSLTHTQLSTVCLTLLHQDMFFLFNLSSFILQFCSQAVCLKLIGRFIWKQSVSWLITTSQVFARVNHSSLSLLSCLRQCWFSPLKLWIKDPSNHVNIKYSSIVTEQPQFYPNI